MSIEGFKKGVIKPVTKNDNVTEREATETTGELKLNKVVNNYEKNTKPKIAVNNPFEGEDSARQRAEKVKREIEQITKQQDLDKRLGVNWDEEDATAKLGSRYETTGGIAEGIKNLKETARLTAEANEEANKAHERQARNDEIDKKYGYGKYKK